jgi:tetratricopeptide (TPR) repeat protein
VRHALQRASIVLCMLVVAGVAGWNPSLATAQPVPELGERARRLFDEERYREAAEVLMQILAVDPGNRTANILLGFGLARAGETAAATEQARRALDLFPTNVKLRLLLAGLLGQQEATRNEALRHYQMVLQQDPDNLLARVGLGEIARVQGRTYDAIHEFGVAAARDPKDPRYEVRIGQLYGSLADLAEARTHFERAYALEPTNVDAIRSLAILGDVEDRPEDMLRYYRELLALYPTDVSVQIAVRAAEEKAAEPNFPAPLSELEKVALETYMSAVPKNSRQLQHRKEQMEATRRRSQARYLPSFFISPSTSTVVRDPRPRTRDGRSVDTSDTLSFSFGWNLADIFVDPFKINITGMEADFEAVRASLMADVSSIYYQRLQNILEYRRLQRALALAPLDAATRQTKQNVKYTILHLTERLRIITGIP